MTSEELVRKTDLAIAELVYDKTDMQKAYNYYNCKMDAELFKYLEDNYGIGLPTSVEFIPLIKKHVDALIGEYLDVPIVPKVSCKDTKTIQNIFRDKQIRIATECFNLLQNNLKNNLLRITGNKEMLDLNIKEQLDKLIEDINENFISEYEIAGLNIIEYIIQSRNIDLINKLRQLFLDLLVTGFTFFRVHPSTSGHNIDIECFNPMNVFPDLNYDSNYINESYRIVVRHYLSRTEVLSKYGKLLTQEEVKKIKDTWGEPDYFDSNVRLKSIINYNGLPATQGIRAGDEVSPGYPEQYWKKFDTTIIPVYEVEWLETDSNFITLRYTTIRIGGDIYILKGKDDSVIRTLDAPEKATLSINGVWFNNRGGKPFSMVGSCMVMQDKYNLLHFYRDSLLAGSGTVGDFINIPTLPTILGNNLAERLMKWKAYSKLGIKLMDTSLEGLVNTGQAPLNTMFNGYDDTIKVQAILAIQLAIESIEQTVSSITGVFRERLNGIQLRDAVSNVKVGVNNSFTITKQWHFLMDLALREILLDSLNCAKIVWKDGLTGVIVLGNKYLKIFTALPKYFTITDFDLHLITSSEIIKEMEQIKQIVPEFIKGNIVGPDILMDIMSAKSISEMKLLVKQSMKKQKAENNLMQQLVQQLEEANNNINQLSQLLKLSEQKVQQLNESKLLLEQTRLKLENEVEMYKAKTDRVFKEARAENDSKRTEIELKLLTDGNPYNDQIKNI